MNILCKLCGHKYEKCNLTLSYSFKLENNEWRCMEETLHTMICTRCENLLGTPGISFMIRNCGVHYPDTFTLGSMSLAREHSEGSVK